MPTKEIMERGWEWYRRLVSAGFHPYILGAAWLKIREPMYDILVKDFDVYCPDFDPGFGEFRPAEKGEAVTYVSPDGLFDVIRVMNRGTRPGEGDLVKRRGVYMVSNTLWMVAVLNKVANFISKRPFEERSLANRAAVIHPLVNCYIFHLSGLRVDPKRAAEIMAGDPFTNTRVLHLYRDDAAWAAAVVASRYYLPVKPEEILTRFCDEVVKPIAREMGVY